MLLLTRFLSTIIPAIAVGGLTLSSFASAYGQSHALINSSRSSSMGNMFVSQAIEGEYGNYAKVAAGAEPADASSRVWKGYGIRNSFGLEVIKFTQFSISHTFLSMRSKADSLENVHGSRVTAEMRLVFSSPVGNMEAGGGFSGSRLDYQRQLDNADLLGSGYFYTLGLNYFISSRVSFFGTGRLYRENLVRSGGNAEIESIRTDTSNLGVGFNIWL